MDREQVLKIICTNLNESSIGVEVGVKLGDFSKKILEEFKGKLYMVDAWRHFPSGYNDIANVSNDVHARFMYSSLQIAMKHDPRAVIIRELSVSASTLFKDESLDFVYLDAAHDHKNVMNDLIAWYPKIKKGGILWGDDYLQGTHYSSEFGVVSAVVEFFKDKKGKVETNVGMTRQSPQWWVEL